MRARHALWCVALLAAALAGCGEGGASKTKAGEPATLKVGVLPIADVAPLYLGAEKGFFKSEKLTLKPQVFQGGAEVTAAVVSGDADFGFSATEPLIVAKSKRLPVEIVTQGNQAGASAAEAWDALMVKGDSNVKSPKDLEGKTIAVNALKSMPELCTRSFLAREGVDISKVKFVEVPFPDMSAALDGGRVDAVATVEPFVSQAKGAGARNLGSYLVSLEPKLTVGTYFSKTPYIRANADVVKRFARAMNRSLEYAQQHPGEVRKSVGDYTKIPPQVSKTMKLSFWGSDLNRPSIERVASEAERFHFVKQRPKLDELIWSGAQSAGKSGG